MIWSAWIALNSRARRARRSSEVDSKPARALASITSSSSSVSSVSSAVPAGRMPNGRTTARPARLRSQTIGVKMVLKTLRGSASQSATPSALLRAMDFGASSAKTITRAVMTAKARATEVTCATASGAKPRAAETGGSMTRASTGSPSQPRARPAIVIPSWVAAMERSRWCSEPRRMRARDCPPAASCSTRVRRTPTNENSAATKSALRRIRTTTAMRPVTITHVSDTAPV